MVVMMMGDDTDGGDGDGDDNNDGGDVDGDINDDGGDVDMMVVIVT